MRRQQHLKDTRGTKDKRQKRRRNKILISAALGCLTIAAIVVTGGGILMHQVSGVRGHLEGTVALVPNLRSQLESENHAEAQATAALMQERTTIARATATGPLWKAASAIPFIGANFRAISEVAVSADDVATRAIGPLVDEYSSLDWVALSPVEGRIEVTQLKEAAPSILQAEKTVRLSYERLNAIHTHDLLSQVASPIRAATAQLKEANTALATASSAAQLLPPMLGSEGQRNYLILVQNNAEVRATGGISGALAILSTNHGQITLEDQGSATALGDFRPPIGVDPEQSSIFTSRLGTQMQNVNLTPDFPTAASTAKQMWEERHSGQVVDGVLSLDPVVLSYLLGATGPVSLTDPLVLGLTEGTSLPVSLTEENVVRTLLSDVYREIENPTAQDVYFASVASSVFAAFTEGTGESGQLLKAFTTSAQEQRIKVWSSMPTEQKVLSGTLLGGSAVGPNVGGATFGAYFNDGTGAKMDYYASRTVQLLQTCQAGDFNGYTVRTTVTNNAPLDAALSLPSYVTGGGVFGVDPGRIRTNYVVYGPAQAFVETASVNGESVPIGTGKHGHRPVGTVTLELGPGESAVLDVAFSRVVQDSEPRLMATPSIAPLEEVILPTITENSCGGSQ